MLTAEWTILFSMMAGDVRQTAHELPYCGVACVYGLLRMRGVDASLDEINAQLRLVDPQVDTSRLNLLQMRGALRGFGVDSEAIHVKRAGLRDVPLPAILVLMAKEGLDAPNGPWQEPNHAVLLTNVTGTKAEFLDFADGGQSFVLSLDELFEIWNGVAVVATSGGIQRPNSSVLPWLTLILVLVAFVAYRRFGVRAIRITK